MVSFYWIESLIFNALQIFVSKDTEMIKNCMNERLLLIKGGIKDNLITRDRKVQDIANQRGFT